MQGLDCIDCNKETPKLSCFFFDTYIKLVPKLIIQNTNTMSCMSKSGPAQVIGLGLVQWIPPVNSLQKVVSWRHLEEMSPFSCQPADGAVQWVTHCTGTGNQEAWPATWHKPSHWCCVTAPLVSNFCHFTQFHPDNKDNVVTLTACRINLYMMVV